jgi:hypothetical protein
MDFVAQKIIRDTSYGNDTVALKVNPVTSKIQFSPALRRSLNLEGKKIGFGYDPSVEKATRAGLYIVDGEDASGCSVSSIGITQTKYHCEMLDRLYNKNEKTIFSLAVSTTPKSIDGIDVYWLSLMDITSNTEAPVDMLNAEDIENIDPNEEDMDISSDLEQLSSNTMFGTQTL